MIKNKISSVIQLGAKELRNMKPSKAQLASVKRQEIYFILDNVLDTYNVGGIFRLADAAGVKKVYLCGETEIPPNPRIKKASINTTEWVEWEYAASAAFAIKDLRSKVNDLKIIALEQDESSVFYTNLEYNPPVALIVGNETTGIPKDILALCDAVIEIPMRGVNKSLNVIVSLGIAVYQIVGK